MTVETPRMMVNACQSLKILFHDSGHAAGTNSWRSHAGNLTWTLDGTLSLKDSYGVYSSADQASAGITGTMPTLTGYGVVFCVGRFASDLSDTGLNTIIGSTDGLYQNAYGAAGGNSDNANQGTLSGTLSILGDAGCVIGICDYVSVSNPLLFGVRANAHGEYDTAMGHMSSGVNLISHTESALYADIHSGGTLLGTTRVGARCKMFGLFDFQLPLSTDEMIASALYMASTYGKLWPGFYGR